MAPCRKAVDRAAWLIAVAAGSSEPPPKPPGFAAPCPAGSMGVTLGGGGRSMELGAILRGWPPAGNTALTVDVQVDA